MCTEKRIYVNTIYIEKGKQINQNTMYIRKQWVQPSKFLSSTVLFSIPFNKSPRTGTICEVK